jgi:glycosyltransferase involved in cell wall biosynthesis
MRVVMLLHTSVEHDSRVRREARTLARRGHEVIVLHLAPTPTQELDPGVRIVSAIPSDGVCRPPLRLYQAVFTVWFAARLVRLRPQAIHAHDVAMLLPGLAGAWVLGAKLVYDTHELALGVPYRSGLLARFVEVVEHVALPRCAGVVAAADLVADRLREHYGLRQRPVVLRNLCDLPRVPMPDREGGAPRDLRRDLGVKDAPLILHQGAATEGRGCETLVRALRHVPRAHVLFMGDSDYAYLEQLARLSSIEGVADRVHFLPSVPAETLLAHTAQADIGVSLLEDTCENHRLTVPNKLYEYVAAGIPVVTSNLPGLRQVVDRYGLGWTVDVVSAEALGCVLRTALERSMNGQCRRYLESVDQQLQWSQEGSRLVELYVRLSA